MASSGREFLLVSSAPDGDDDTITAYDLATGAVLSIFSCCRTRRRGLILAGNSLIAASRHSTASCSIALWNWCSPSVSQSLPTREPVAALSSAGGGAFLFSGGISGRIHSHAIPSDRILLSFPAHSPSAVSCLAVSEERSLLDSFSGYPPQCLQRISAHSLPVSGVRPSRTTVVSCSADATCKVWCLSSGTHLGTLAFPCHVSCMDMDPVVYAAGVLLQGERIEVVAKHGAAISAVEVEEDGRGAR